VRELGIVSAADNDQYLGERPSKNAIVEVLTKKIPQNPTFYTKLYESPTNVERIGAMQDAVGLYMLGRIADRITRINMELSQDNELGLIEEQERIVNAGKNMYGAGGKE
jgi:hypothetical protein